MAQTHRTTGTAKGNGHKIVIPEEAAFWDDYVRQDDIEALRKEGWVTPQDVADATGAPLNHLRQRMYRDPALERKQVRIRVGRQARSMLVFRRKRESKTSDKPVKG